MSGVKEVSVSTGQSRIGAEEPFVLVIFGASGDLTHRKLVPSVYGLHCDGLLPRKRFVVGYARSDLTHEAFRDGLRESVKRHSRAPLDARTWQAFASRIFYLRGRYDSGDDFIRLGRFLADLTAKEGMAANWLFYLATPPDQFAQVAEQLGKAGLGGRDISAGAGQGWRRIVTEKPFGRDLASAESLNRVLRRVFDERQIFRIDHYLGKETVRNLLVLRFANSIFEPIWNQKHVDHVQITVGETLGVEKRGPYYDGSGALRDMLANHMMNLLCLVAMEPPATLAADAIRNEKVKVLQALRAIPPDCAGHGVVRAQYGQGEVAGRPVPGYLQEPGVAGDSRTETFVALKLHVDNWHWAGVPFYLRTGKRLAMRVTEIVIQFKPVPRVLFNTPPAAPLAPNLLVVRIQPDEGVSLQFQVKQPGAATRIHPYTMDFTYAGAFGAVAPDAYERLLLDAAMGDSTLFIRSDEIEAAWRFLTPVLEGCDLERGKPLPQYAPCSWGPTEADRLIASEGHRWHEPREVQATKTTPGEAVTMSKQKGAVTSHGKPLTLVGNLPTVGLPAPDAELLANDMSPVRLSDYRGKLCILSAVPSLDTPVCERQTRRFNTEAASLGENVAILTISMDLPFAQGRWCGAAGIDRVRTLSDHRSAAFGQAYGVFIEELRLLARAVFVVDGAGVLRYRQLVKEITQEPDYTAVLEAVRRL